MSPSPTPQNDDQPYTQTSDVDNSDSIYSAFLTKSDNMDNPYTPSPDELSSWSWTKSSGSDNGNTRNSRTTTLETVTTPTDGAATASGNAASPTNGSSATGSASSSTSLASSAANNATDGLQKESSDGMSSPGMQAAVAVPVVVVVAVIVGLIFFCMRRRKKRQAVNSDETEKASPETGRRKKWTRHLRVFSFDTELLMGGRYSSSNSIRSRQTGSVRSNNRSQHSGSPSVHSVDEVAPPYRDAISAAQPPNIGSVMAVPHAAAVASPAVNRSASNATAPPPYGAAGSRLSTPSSPSATRSVQEDPFADNTPVSPMEAVEGSPFNDPPGTTPPISRNSSLYRTDRDDVSTIGDGASIREATLARNASVMSGGRIINNIRNESQ